MIHEWISQHKKLALFIAIGSLVTIGIIISLLVSMYQNRDAHEETQETAAVQVSNIDILYNNFSDYQVGYLFNALNKALVDNQSMKNGSPASENKMPPTTATNDELYPSINKGNYTLTIKDNEITDFEDSWGMWKKFTVQTQDNRSFQVKVAIGAYSRENDVDYMQIIITKL